MPEFTALHLAMLASAFVVGVGLGWLLRSDRSAREKIAINAGWQEQVEAQQVENERLTEQNRGLMRQVSEQQASGKDSSARAKSLAGSLKQALEQRDELNRKLKDLRGSLDAAVRERERLQEEIGQRDQKLAAEALTLKEKDNKIFKLSRQLSSWQTRVPPLVEKFRERDRDAQALQAELDRAINRIAELEVLTRPDETRIEAIGEGALGRLDASNEQYGESGGEGRAALDDRVGAWYDPPLTAPASFVHETGTEEPILREEPVTAAAPEPAPVADGRDDLQRIKGVGPAIEKALNELGIYRYEQIAAITEYDIDRVAARLRGFRSRIYREDWIGQARELEQQRDTN